MMTSSSMSLTPYQSQLLSKHRLVASCWMQNDERDQKRHILTLAIYQIGKISMKNRKKGVMTSSSKSSNLSYLSLLLSKPRLVAYNWMQNLNVHIFITIISIAFYYNFDLLLFHGRKQYMKHLLQCIYISCCHNALYSHIPKAYDQVKV